MGFYLSFLTKNILYNTGNNKRVNKVDENKPPIITVANGFCTSEPTPLDNKIGSNPNAVIDAVIRTGRNLDKAPSKTP